jgi:hypothetical protein
MGRFGYPSLRRQLAGLEPGSRAHGYYLPAGWMHQCTTGTEFAQQLELSEKRVIDFSADPLEQVLAQRPQGTQQSLDESVGKLRKGRPPNQVRVRYAMPMSLRARGRAPSL